MDIWHYDRETGELLGAGAADPDPEHAGRWLLPAFSTTTAPPPKEPGRAILLVDGAWLQVEDHRGEVWWGEDGEPVIIRDVGDPAQLGLSPDEPPPPPPAEPDPNYVPNITPRQLFIGMAREGFITWPEAVEAAATGAVPAAVDEAFSELPEQDAAEARITWARMSIVERSSPLTEFIIAGKAEPAAVDMLFREWAAI